MFNLVYYIGKCSLSQHWLVLVKRREKRLASVVSQTNFKMAKISEGETPSIQHKHLSIIKQSLAIIFSLKLCLTLFAGGSVHYFQSVFQIKKTDGRFVLCSKLWIDFCK
jgi:hypothetical protein